MSLILNYVYVTFAAIKRRKINIKAELFIILKVFEGNIFVENVHEDSTMYFVE